MIDGLKQYLNNSYTAYQAVENAEALLKANGFSLISEKSEWDIKNGGSYYFVRNGSALVAFKVGNGNYFKIAASHTDSPALKIKQNPLIKENGYVKLNVEKYGGGILYTFFDRPLKVAGRIVIQKDGALITKSVVSNYELIIPSQAIHINRSVNDGVAINAQTDMCPIFDVCEGDTATDFYKTLTDEKVLGADLYLVNAEECRCIGASGKLLAAPRVDNLTSAYASIQALIDAEGNDGISIAALFNSEEIGNGTSEGAASDMLENTMKRIACSLGISEQAYFSMLAKSFLLSVDVAHAIHPNHPEKSDPTNKPKLDCGIVIKYNANGSYVTDAVSSATVKNIFAKADVPCQTFHAKSDMPCGSTLGKSFICRTGMLACDIGIPQLAMHSAYETFAKNDFLNLYKGIHAFFRNNITVKDVRTDLY